MNAISILSVFILIFSCGYSSPKATIDKRNQIQKEQHIELNIDSITVNYWKSTEANEYLYRYLDRVLEIKGRYFGVNMKILDTIVVNKFTTYINTFYIDKTEKIILEKKKQPMMITDYPSITVVGYKGGKQVFIEHTQIGDENYALKFNPNFLAFYEFLENLTTLK